MCRAAGRPAKVLGLGTVLREQRGEIVEGVLLCPAAECMREHPIIDGIPIVVADIRAQIQGQLSQLLMRQDLSPVMLDLLGDCVGPESEYERNRYHLSTYCRSHYGDLDPDLPIDREHGLVGLFERGMELLGQAPRGVWLDIGCSVGRTTLEMAARTGDLVIGVDLNLGMLRTAKSVARTGRVEHPLRRGGIAYQQRSFAVDIARAAPENVEFWACDAMALPFANRTFAGALSFNVTDCVPSPVGHLMEMGRVIDADGLGLLTTPYDWSAGATPLENWIGGHSQRSESAGESARELRRVLGADAPDEVHTRMSIERELDAVPWHVFVHERATMQYLVHLVVTRRDPSRT